MQNAPAVFKQAEISGQIDNLNVSLSFAGLIHNDISTITASGMYRGSDVNGSMMINLKSGIVTVHSQPSKVPGITLSDISAEEMSITVFSSPAKIFRLSTVQLVKTKSLKASVVGAHGSDLVALTGEQPYDQVYQDLDPIVRDNASFNQFLDDMDKTRMGLAKFSNWCIPFYCIPIAGIFTYAVKACR